MSISMNAAPTAVNPEPIEVDLKRFRGRGVQPRSLFADEVVGHLVSIKMRPGTYIVTRKDGKPVIDPNTGQPMERPNSATATWVDQNGNTVLTSWSARFDDKHRVVLWDAFDQSIDLSTELLHYKKEVDERGRTWYTLERVQVQVSTQPETQDDWVDYYC